MSTRPLLFLVLVLFASLALSNAQAGYDQPMLGTPPPPFAVKGKEFPPETTFCIDPNTTCFSRTVSCPKQCPQFKPADPKAKGCYIDCNNPTCEGICKNRKPNCEGNGAACYDPRFIGGDGIMFYFHGKANHHFALVSDSDLQINARFIGTRPAGRRRDFTWIQSLALLFGTHSFTLSADPTSVWDPRSDHFSFTFDGLPIPLDIGYLSTWSADDLSVERTATVNSVTVTLSKVVEIMVTAVPVTAEDDRIHGYGIPKGDSFTHLEVQFRFFGLSGNVEGVLGQTYRPEFKNPVKRGVPMPVMSGEDRYIVDSILSTECRYCIFKPKAGPLAVVEEVAEEVATLDCGGKMSNGYRVVCRR